ncbi:Phosphoglycolate phosphatase [Geobacillus stearothermophilus]|uniref:HAD family hydrolase n=1 Tax=Geobacillus sp. DSP4a TaxID=2508873 RepID=UPI0007ABA4AD|nr:HAD family hydrolase [Geobacillus sp. DSP4a]KZE93085.1 Phosphoglycolate phosphatase [Geobacillus stearothermophilus]NNU98311.1 HAD family hydrolase [Geobacillus sp. DSP4a]WJQ08571.1 HAD family hydrolase [Geobacillus stearothermophilus]
MNGADIKAIVFDLDGTLYEETEHFDYYAEQVAKRLKTADRPRFWDDYRAVLAGRHPLRIGSVYDTKEDLILQLEKGAVREARRWSGEQLEARAAEALYPGAVTIDLDRFFSIGDLWWVPSSIGRHYGLTNEDTYAAFLETREWMMGPEFTMKGAPGFAETLAELREKTALVLMTNSPEPDSEAILRKLGLADVFHYKIFQAAKPVKTVAHLEAIRARFGVEYKQMLCVGDNIGNDIAPARRLGCRTMLIDAYGLAKPGDADVIVASTSACVPVLRRLL